MKKKFFRKAVCLAAAVILIASSLDAAGSQTKDKIKSTGKNIDELEEQKKDAQEKVGALKEEESSLKGELAGLNQQLSDVSAQINDLEGQIQQKQEEIQTTKEELKEAEIVEAKQYESMKLRIRFIYENGNTDLITALLGSESLADLLNRVEYVTEMNRYDRQMLSDYEETCKQISSKKKTLKNEKQELIAMQESMEQKEEQVNGLIAKTQTSIQSKQNEISNAQETVEDFETQIAKMKAYEEELERKKAEEAKKQAAAQKAAAQKAAEQQKGNSGSGTSGTPAAPSGGGSVTANASDLAMLAAIVECEAGGESYEGQWAVASVVVNRVKSGSFPNTISGVIYQSGQFSPVASGRFAVVLAQGAGSCCTQAASTALSGSTNVNFLYFCRASSGVEGTVIGNHVFY